MHHTVCCGLIPLFAVSSCFELVVGLVLHDLVVVEFVVVGHVAVPRFACSVVGSCC